MSDNINFNNEMLTNSIRGIVTQILEDLLKSKFSLILDKKELIKIIEETIGQNKNNQIEDIVDTYVDDAMKNRVDDVVKASVDEVITELYITR